MSNYYLTYKCNSRCTYCDIPIKPENIRIKETSPEIVIENLAALKRLGVKIIDFTGGEPLIYKHLPKVLRAAKEMGFFTSIANTGTLYPRMAKELVGLVDDLKFSLSTTDSAEYKAERGIDGYEKVIESIKLAKSLGEQPSIIATGTPESIGGMERVVRLAQDLGIVMLLGPVFDFCENELLREEGIKEIRRLATLDNVCVNWSFLQFYLDGGNQIAKPRCRAISSVVVVSPDDHMLLPCYHMHDERIKITHENGRSNLDELWRSTHVQTRRKQEGSWSFCQNCTIWCYFETSFLWPPDKYFFLNMKSKGQWAKAKLKQFVESKTSFNFTRRLPGSTDKILADLSANPMSGFKEEQPTASDISVSTSADETRAIADTTAAAGTTAIANSTAAAGTTAIANSTAAAGTTATASTAATASTVTKRSDDKLNADENCDSSITVTPVTIDSSSTRSS
jgi:MoaA/NifB/PqqE/SkfB family radical SAM enzyme